MVVVSYNCYDKLVKYKVDSRRTMVDTDVYPL